MLTRLPGGHLSKDVNVVPMIDVLLVLLIIFMLLLPNRHVIRVQVPVPAPAPPPSAPAIVLAIDEIGRYQLNGQIVSAAALDDSLTALFSDRPRKMLFLRAAPNRKYQELVTAMDVAKGAGIEVLSWMPRATAAAGTAQ